MARSKLEKTLIGLGIAGLLVIGTGKLLKKDNIAYAGTGLVVVGCAGYSLIKNQEETNAMIRGPRYNATQVNPDYRID